MPTINKLPKKQWNQREEKTASREIRHQAYNLTEWRKLRIVYLQLHPLCENCLAQGRVKPAADVHHIKSPFFNGTYSRQLLLDEKNLRALCKECHAAEHGGGKTQEEIIDELDALLK